MQKGVAQTVEVSTSGGAVVRGVQPAKILVHQKGELRNSRGCRPPADDAIARDITPKLRARRSSRRTISNADRMPKRGNSDRARLREHRPARHARRGFEPRRRQSALPCLRPRARRIASDIPAQITYMHGTLQPSRLAI
ncbi:hypothetical protein BD310DRAFT_27731 [Dichomitus squalens]|uniref:Uncharacterized protein n=1 Tax=Dichomitus squalens TaxID=114155 RepID=A0A4Q9QDF0_9APHY|nr:hypothetical protein BD310DRAFT_27731 [Dichomitus squalens]